jgi:hypothetical protein
VAIRVNSAVRLYAMATITSNASADISHYPCIIG